MKKLLLFMLLLTALPMAMMAEEVTINGITYNLINKVKEAIVINFNFEYQQTPSLTIPTIVEYNGEQYEVTKIEGSAIKYDHGYVTSISVDSNNKVYDSRNSCNAIIETATNELVLGCANTVIPSTVTSIGDGAFYGCSNIVTIDIPESVNKIGSYAFSGCTNLISINIPEGVNWMGSGAFNGCSKLESINIPTGLGAISDILFAGCTSLLSINIPDGVSAIYDEAFFGCTGLTSITIPNSVTKICRRAFYGCNHLTNIDLGTGLETMLSEDTYVENIEEEVFAECTEIEQVICRAIPTEKNEFGEQGLTVSGSSFNNSYIENAKLLVPFDYLTYFQSTEPWSNFGTIEALPQYPEITADDYERKYGDPNPNPWPYTIMGPAITGVPDFTCPATQTSAPGTYPIVITAGTVIDPNATFNNGTLTITPAPLTIRAKSYTIKQGDPLPSSFEIEYGGFKNNETASDLTAQPTVTSTVTDSNTPGSYDITVSGATSNNYDITCEDGKLNIRPNETMADNGNGTYLPWGQNTPWMMTYIHQEQDNGVAPANDSNGKAWYDTDFDDSEWNLLTGPVDRSGCEHFGLGAGNYYDMQPEGSCLYLRRSFNIDATEYANLPNPLVMKMSADDRADFYLNGKLVGSNENIGNFDHTFTIAKSDFVVGDNLLAIYYHDESGEAYLDYSLMAADISSLSPFTDQQGITYELNNTQTAWAVTGMIWNENQTSINIPGSQFGLPVTTVNENVFNGHGYITSITLNEGLTTIQGWAFYGTGITSINIPASVTEIFTDHDNYGNYQPANPFGGCSKLATITVDANNTVYSSPTGSNAIIETATNKLVVGCKGTDMAKLPNVTEIGYAAFHDLSGMTEFTIPSNITTIGEGAFWGCSDLSAVTVESTTPINISGMSYPPFDGTKKYKLYVPVGTKALYQAADGWNEFKYIWEIDETETYPAQGYAYFDASTGTLTFTCDDQYLSHGNAKVFLDVVNGDPNYDGHFEWSSDGDTYYNVNTVVFDPSFANVKPTSTSSWFAYMENLTSIQGIEYLNTTEVTTMRHMFYQCRQLSSIDVSKFNTSKVTDMSHMFRECSSLTSLDLRNFDTSNVVDFGEMFKECSSLSNLDISSFVTSSAEDMEEMFRECYSLTDINLSHFDVTKVTDMHYMFYNCSGLTSLTLPKEMDKLINFSSPCYNVGQWGSAPCLLVVPSDFNFNGVNISQSPFCWADGYFNSPWEAYAELDANSKLTFYFDDQRGNRTGTTYDIDGSYIGYGATSVAFDKSFANYLPSSTAQWFKNMTALTSISGLENLITWNVYDMNEMFSGCSSLESIDMSNFDVSNAVANGNTSYMFYGCSGLKELSVSESMCDLASDACDGVGTTTEPCELNVPEKFVFQGVSTTGAYFNWKAGYFKLATEETITITSAGVATYCSRRDLDFSNVTGLKAYIATGYNRTTGNVIVQPVNNAPAGTGLYLKGAPGTYKVPYAPSGSYYVNMLVGVTEPTTITPTDGDLSNLLLRNGSQGLGFYGFTNETYTVGANKAYLQIPTSMMPTAGANYIGLEFEEGVTGIDTSSMAKETTEGWFSIDGRKLNGKPTRKGVYVNNGRKIVIK